MKKINSILMILAAAAGFTNCTKTELVENKEAGNGGTVVYATTDAATKTTLSSDYKVLWSNGDKIKFVNTETPATTYTFTLSEGEGTTKGTFTYDGTPDDGTYTVYYPATYDDTNWPAQTYVSDTDISGAPMKASATVTDGKVSDITFTNEGGILRYTVKGDKTIRTINVKAGSDLNVTLACGTSGKPLTEAGTVFNIALPAGTYSNASLKFTATDNTVAAKSATSFIVTKNKVSLATFEASALSFVPDGFVDLGVTDSFGNPLYWAKMNLGADNPEDPGDYYMWGATALIYSAVDYTKTEGAFTFVTDNPYGDNYKNTWDVSNGFGWNNIPFADGFFADGSTGTKNVFTKYTTKTDYAKSGSPDNITTLLPKDDAATADNSSCRIPTKADFEALCANCVWIWTTDYNGIHKAGYIVYKVEATGDKGLANMNGTWKQWNGGESKYKNYSGATPSDYAISKPHIFLPAAGYGNGNTLSTIVSSNNIGDYFTSSLNEMSNEKAFALVITQSNISIGGNNYRHYGYTIRPVTSESAIPPPAPTFPPGA